MMNSSGTIPDVETVKRAQDKCRELLSPGKTGPGCDAQLRGSFEIKLGLCKMGRLLFLLTIA